ncbi:hypothetical protein TNIN_204011 [Trichonephila inaurata madagascariensis]|uniref:Uncharacterized protein n=1 Tax=Trichonephila inaurata madagascariensis TaxID=2747483 RepID=A0A8X6X4V9_9ARAC|nr:hypothetical protein TNIN_204011 [Trichonephila inaurata madagascariensis]
MLPKVDIKIEAAEVFRWCHLGLNSTQDVLCTACKCYVRLVVEYGIGVLINASDLVLNRLNLFQNSMLRLFTGGAKTTAIATMELHTDLEPLSERSLKHALDLNERILRRKNNLLNYYIPTNERLKSRMSFNCS